MRVALAFVLLYLTLDRLAAALESTRGEKGLAVCIVVLVLATLTEHWLRSTRFGESVRALGLGPSKRSALFASILLSALLLACLPLLAYAAGVPLASRENAIWLAVGIFAQGGVAEEVLFRGFLYRHLRSKRTFWRAACLSALPFAAAHVPLFWLLDPAVATFALGTAVASSFPLAWLFDRAGGSIWPGVILHFAIQGGIKLIADDDSAFHALAIAWAMLCLVLPWALFLLREKDVTSGYPAPFGASER